MTKTPTTPQAPGYLRSSTRRWWEDVVQTWQLESHHIMTLTVACECWDRAQQARQIIAKEGITIATRDGAKAHPAVAVERDSRLAFLRALRELDLDVSTPAEWKRPPQLRSLR